MRPQTHPSIKERTWSPAILKGLVVPTSAEVCIEIGGSVERLLCIGLAEDGFVVESQRALPLRQLLRCTLRLPESDELELFAFAAADSVEARQEIKPMGMNGAMAARWQQLRDKLGGAVLARGTGPTRPLKSGVYLTMPRQRGDWFWRLLGRAR